jgi:hypothetical protein
MARSTMQAGVLGQRDVGTHAGRHHDQVGGDFLAIGEAHRLHPALALDLGGLAVQQDAQAAPFQRWRAAIRRRASSCWFIRLPSRAPP